jgi:phage terminase Nu1 subunit (DNA packaging protein)
VSARNLEIKNRRVVTPAVLGDWLGLTSDEVAAETGNFVAAAGGFALEESIRAFCAHLRQGASGRETPTVVERRRLIRAQANLAEMKSEIESGVLLAVDDVLQRTIAQVRHVRSLVLAVPSRISGKLPHLTRGDIARIDDVVRDKLTVAAKCCDDDVSDV